jgi:hypothetical protein
VKQLLLTFAGVIVYKENKEGIIYAHIEEEPACILQGADGEVNG